MSYMNRGLSDIKMYKPEPVIVDEIGIALGAGPDGYRASFRNIHAYGVSNLTITQVRYVTKPKKNKKKTKTFAFFVVAHVLIT